jgi:hypothetical protein
MTVASTSVHAIADSSEKRRPWPVKAFFGIGAATDQKANQTAPIWHAKGRKSLNFKEDHHQIYREDQKYCGRTNYNINDPVALILITYQDVLKQDETLQQLEEIQEYQVLIPDKSSSFVIDMVCFLRPFSVKQTLEVQWRS